MPDRSLSPHLRPFGPQTYTKMKVEYPPESRPRAHICWWPGGVSSIVTCTPCATTKTRKKSTFHNTRVLRLRYEKHPGKNMKNQKKGKQNWHSKFVKRVGIHFIMKGKIIKTYFFCVSHLSLLFALTSWPDDVTRCFSYRFTLFWVWKSDPCLGYKITHVTCLGCHLSKG